MLGTAGDRFWRGVREPWDLLGRMRHVRPLWARYWRTVLLQAGLTLVAGLAIFWVGKQGAEAWNDAFGPEEPPVSSAPATAGAGGSSATGAASAAPEAAPASGTAGAPSASPRGTPGAPRRAPSPPPTPPPPPAKAPTAAPPPSPATPRSSTPGAEPVVGEKDQDEKDSDEDDADEEDTPVDEAALEGNLEEKIKALQNAPPDERAKRTAELVAAAVDRAKREAGRAERRASKQKGQGQGEETKDELAEDREALTDRLEELTIAAEALAKETPENVGKARRARRQLEHGLDQAEKEARKLERKGAAPLSEAETARIARARAALEVARRHERGLAGRLGAVLALLAAIYASLGIAQTGMLALTRDFHDALSRELSLLVHVAPEDPPMRPRIRLDLPWVRRKAKRRAHFFLGFLPGTVLIWVVARFLPQGKTITTVLTSVWAAYWWMVMTAGQSARAWTPPETTPRPWYLRAWFALTDKVFLVRWVLGWWGRLWERMARRFYGPSERVEEQPLEFAGLALSRALTLIPVVKLLLRPLFTVSAARLLVEHASTARLPIPVTAAEVAVAALRAPDAEARAHSGLAS